ncbi:hypothetical protein GCM10009733_107190 [Nonomuraea maheshkhaliensis]|uniref:Pirin C-terminal domain-containing protein n=1 Tax=Nonomuraea maheshkhaliensis TaxID=419590 RepID=A0ABN2HUY9_9ACTN
MFQSGEVAGLRGDERPYETRVRGGARLVASLGGKVVAGASQELPRMVFAQVEDPGDLAVRVVEGYA